MEIEDLTDLTRQAVNCLMQAKDLLRLPDLEIQCLSEFAALVRRQDLNAGERREIVEDSILLIEQLYSHLPFKCARYAINPSRRLRLLLNTVNQLTAMEFHQEMLDIFFELRDAHTFYALPEPYRDRAAFLPFLLGSYWDGKRPRFIVTQTMEALEHGSFVSGVEITHWNGTPMQTAVARMADHSPAGNPSARFVRGLARLTLRMLTYSPLPDEEMVFVQYRPLTPRASERVVAFPWSVAKGLTAELFGGMQTSVCGPLAQSAVVRQILWLRQGRLTQQDIHDKCRKWDPDWRSKKKWDHVKRGSGPPGVDINRVSFIPEAFEFQYAGGDPDASVKPDWLADPTSKHRKLGYLRIKRFDAETDEQFFADRFVAECQRIVQLLSREAPDGLILDLRGNPGGEIEAAERILQFFTPSQITPAQFHIVNTLLTQEIAKQLTGRLSELQAVQARSELEPWLKDVQDSITEGDLITHGHPITDPEDANDTGQIYHGPVVVLMDARVYSAAEIFLGGFQDHAIGKLIGVQETTGGGGANRWLHKDVALVAGQIPGLSLDPVPDRRGLKVLPHQANLAVAIRRSSRTQGNAGAVIEDVGVRRDIAYEPTLDDLPIRRARPYSFCLRPIGDAALVPTRHPASRTGKRRSQSDRQDAEHRAPRMLPGREPPTRRRAR